MQCICLPLPALPAQVALLEGGYCLDSLAESAALSLRELLGDPCPVLAGGGPSQAVLPTIQVMQTLPWGEIKNKILIMILGEL